MTSSVPPARTHDRALPDRRRRPTPMFSRYWLRGRRRGGRRDGERERIYVDGYTRREWSIVGGLVLLSAVDLGLTLIHLAAGGAEANPVMALALDGGVGWFAVAKTALTVGATGVLLVHVRFPLARRALVVLVLVYLCLMVWHGWVWGDRVP